MKDCRGDKFAHLPSEVCVSTHAHMLTHMLAHVWKTEDKLGYCSLGADHLAF